jgi:predicted nucleic acid-binding protein
VIRTFVDAGILIAAARGYETHSQQSLKLLTHYKRRILTSVFIRLETLPKVVYNPYPLQRSFLNQFFSDPEVEWVSDLNAVANLATLQSEKYGLSALDALHIGAAMLSDASECVTTENRGKPIYRVREVDVRYIGDMDFD